MERRASARAPVDFPVDALIDGHWHVCRAIDLSTTGLVLERPHTLDERETVGLPPLELDLGHAFVRVRARAIWTVGRRQALKFVLAEDVDRLVLAEYLDLLCRRGVALH